ncbi:hypothetical protein BDR03DRAFT_986456 [Suillus americanus]|nr:hypothetical protein BDR03DRAFT_986456 [Suillus americanus]
MSDNPSQKRNHAPWIVPELQLKAWHTHLSIRIIPHASQNIKAFGNWLLNIVAQYWRVSDIFGSFLLPALSLRLAKACNPVQYCWGCITQSATVAMAAGLTMALRMFLEDGPFNDADTSGSD